MWLPSYLKCSKPITTTAIYYTLSFDRYAYNLMLHKANKICIAKKRKEIHTSQLPPTSATREQGSPHNMIVNATLFFYFQQVETSSHSKQPYDKCNKRLLGLANTYLTNLHVPWLCNSETQHSRQGTCNTCSTCNTQTRCSRGKCIVLRAERAILV